MKLLDPCGCFPTGRHYPGIAHLIEVRVVGVAEDLGAEARWSDEIPIAFLDTETTGTNSKADRVIEVGLVIGRQGDVVARYNWLINPGIPIPQESSDVHGITDDDVEGKPTFAEVLPDIVEALRGALPAAYNATFDKGFLLEEVARTGLRFEQPPPALRPKITWVDPLVFAREIYKGKGESRALGAVAERLGIALVNAHRATDDAEAALRVLYAFGRDERLPPTYAALIQEQRRLAQIQAEAMRFWRR